ncbi:MAG TPA: hypothetical protein VLG25_00815 [Patescibacteria group bacterium]|nr:hypothetical protein [Patescibacteria group bacterium]
MNKDQIISKVKALRLPQGEYIVFGSCPLALAGIRPSRDIDLLVSPALRETLRKAGWQQITKSPNDKPLTFGEFEAHDNWNFTSYSPSLKSLLATATIVDGVPFASLEEVRKWKAAGTRPKDLADIKLIDEYLNNTSRKT